MISNLTSEQEIVKGFVNSIELKHFNKIGAYLAENGVFDIQDEKLETKEVSKDNFLNWFKAKLNISLISKTEYDSCLHCYIGNPVVLFNNGEFPRILKGSYERSKTGLMLDIKEGKIHRIQFCFVFAKTGNKYGFECTNSPK